MMTFAIVLGNCASAQCLIEDVIIGKREGSMLSSRVTSHKYDASFTERSVHFLRREPTNGRFQS